MRTLSLNRNILLSLTALCSFTVSVSAQSALTSVAHVGLVYPLSTNGKNAAAYTNSFSLHLIAGVSKSETGVAIAGVSNIIKENASGTQVAAFSNHMGSASKNASFAGFMNLVKRDANGVMVAGFLNHANSMKGFQMAGFANIVDRSAAGSTQLAGFMNKADSADAQVTGFLNTAKAGKTQVAGFMNQSDEVHTQVAGFINIAKKVRGVQIAGFINIADSSEYPIGIVNIIKSGERQVSVSIDETATAIASFKSGGRILYGILGLGYNFKNSTSLYALQAGIGAHLHLLSHFRLNAEATNMFMTDFKRGSYNRVVIGAYPSYRFGNRVEVFAGPTLNTVYNEDGLGDDLTSHFIWSRTRSDDEFVGVYVGATVGVQVKL
ncbi:hypothetical protein [Chitinophaga sp. MM2321]|uniref:hypothetical protein n=1 Tax=Chitinophaga sp. MM2321 TaxID=3137178 RepID=UPI0032D59991